MTKLNSRSNTYGYVLIMELTVEELYSCEPQVGRHEDMKCCLLSLAFQINDDFSSPTLKARMARKAKLSYVTKDVGRYCICTVQYNIY